MNFTLTPPYVLLALLLVIVLSACGGERGEPASAKPDAGKTPVIRCAP